MYKRQPTVTVDRGVGEYRNAEVASLRLAGSRMGRVYGGGGVQVCLKGPSVIARMEERG